MPVMASSTPNVLQGQSLQEEVNGVIEKVSAPPTVTPTPTDASTNGSSAATDSVLPDSEASASTSAPVDVPETVAVSASAPNTPSASNAADDTETGRIKDTLSALLSLKHDNRTASPASEPAPAPQPAPTSYFQNQGAPHPLVSALLHASKSWGYNGQMSAVRTGAGHLQQQFPYQHSHHGSAAMVGLALARDVQSLAIIVHFFFSFVASMDALRVVDVIISWIWVRFAKFDGRSAPSHANFRPSEWCVAWLRQAFLTVRQYVISNRVSCHRTSQNIRRSIPIALRTANCAVIVMWAHVLIALERENS